MRNSKLSEGELQDQRVRCAIYTRKSTEEGLEQEFNSLDAQREAAEAYIRSQRQAGWRVVPERFEDAGWSGGNLERPALQRLLAAVRQAQVDCVVVYKVDRLSRSLLDFAQIMSVFEQQGVSFVSVTQQFNTTTSLGRLTLNIVLSFAQFEREIIGERTRDKMWAAKQKGQWVGGFPPLGYDVDAQGGGLVVNAVEAEQVREMFQITAECGAVGPAVEAIHGRGWKTKSWTTGKGIYRPGRAFDRAGLIRLLSNPVYIGAVRWRGQMLPAAHSGILDPEVWRRVQAWLASPGDPATKGRRGRVEALLRGLLFCKPCQSPMVPTYGVKRERRYRYYVCAQAQKQGWSSCPSKSVSAHGIEESVLEQLHQRGLGPGPEDTDAPRSLDAMLERIEYDGLSGQVCIRLRAAGGDSSPEEPNT